MLFKRKQIWYYKFMIGGKTIYRSTTSTADKEKAQEMADKVKAVAWGTIKGGEQEKYLWQQAVVS
jgi:hypothetical protein|nr:hypothetical protein [methanotrophic endosymbiont of Bathymodiolus puteoserpentis (Logatchev)]